MIIKHTFYNLAGLGLPLLAAIFSIPILISELGIERFGLLTLIWAIVSYFGLFDMGLGRALTRELADVFDQEKDELIGPLVMTALVIMTGLGVVAGLLMVALAPWGIALVKGVPDQQEAINAVYVMALAMPFIVLTACFRGILEAKQAFGILNLIRLPMGLFTFLGPLAVVLYGQPRLDWISLVLVAGRILGCVFHAWPAWLLIPRNHGPLRVHTYLIKSLSVSGGWMTVSNIISPFMGFIDRFLLGFLVSANAVTYYVTPQELVTKLSIIPGSLTAVLFPIFSAKKTIHDGQMWLLLKLAVNCLFLVLLPLTVSIALFANELLTLWINKDFADQSAIYMQIFAVGVLINSLSQIAFTLIQSYGKSRVTAIVHLVELPLFVITVCMLTLFYGGFGALIAWFLRIALDAVLMFTQCSRMLFQPIKDLFSHKVLGFLLLALIEFSGILIESITGRLLWTILITIVSTLLIMVLRKNCAINSLNYLFLTKRRM